jgi:hypothetical protein
MPHNGQPTRMTTRATGSSRRVTGIKNGLRADKERTQKKKIMHPADRIPQEPATPFRKARSSHGDEGGRSDSALTGTVLIMADTQANFPAAAEFAPSVADMRLAAARRNDCHRVRGLVSRWNVSRAATSVGPACRVGPGHRQIHLRPAVLDRPPLFLLESGLGFGLSLLAVASVVSSGANATPFVVARVTFAELDVSPYA